MKEYIEVLDHSCSCGNPTFTSNKDKGKTETTVNLREYLTKKNITSLIIAIFIMLALILALQGRAWWSNHKIAPTQSAQSVVAGVKELASLLTAEMQVVTTIEGQDNKIFGVDIPLDVPGTKRLYFIVVPAKVMAGIDLQKVGVEDIKVDDGQGKIYISLPPANFLQEVIEIDKLKIYTSEGLFRPRTTIQESLNFISQAQVSENLRLEAMEAGLLKTAELNASRVLEKFYQGLGYQVEVNFKN